MRAGVPVAKKDSRFAFRGPPRCCRRTSPGRARLRPPATRLVGAIILLGGIGYAVDRWRGTAPWVLFIGLVLGIVVGFYELVKAVRR